MPHLFYVMGSSGAGKDSIMNFARQNLEKAELVLFAHRYITRPASDPTENHIYLTEEEFKNRLKGNLFALHWFSHGFYYGIGIEIKTWMQCGFNVVVNGSREYLPIALAHFPHMNPIMIEVRADILRERLIRRGRESLADIEKRMSRNEMLDHAEIPCTRVWNNTTLEESGREFIRIISQS